MSLRRAIPLLGVLTGIVVIVSFAVWYFVRPEIQFFIYWVVGIVVAVLVTLAAVVQITGYSLRDFLAKPRTANIESVVVPVPQITEPKRASLFLVPFSHNPDFVGREADLATLHEMLQQGNSPVGIRPTVLVGLGGIGKTQLAVEYAHAHRDDYPGGIFWLNAINSLLIEFSDLAEKLEMADREMPRDKAARKVCDYLDSHSDALVIFDNVLEPSELNLPFSPDLVPANLRCRTLFTTRQRDLPRNFQSFEVKVLPEMAAMCLLLRSRPEVLEEHHPEWGWARIVCASLGWLPLALELAAAYLGAYPEVSITGYLERLRTEGSLETVDESEVRAVDLPTRVEEILKAAAAGNLEIKHQVAVSATLQTQWNRLDDKDAQSLFRAAGQFPEASWIPLPRLGLLTGIESEAKAGHPSPLNVVLKKLNAVSLIEELSEDRLRLHPLVQEFAARLSPASFRLEMAERVAIELNDLIRLQARVIQYGIDMALEDLRTGLGFCIEKPESETYSYISKMERALDRQAHELRGWDVQAQPAFFLQQLRNESLELDSSDLQARAEAALAQLRRPCLCERFKVGRDSPELVRTLQGRGRGIKDVALSMDGQLAVSASWDGILQMWDVATGRELRSFKEDSKWGVDRVALSANGRLAISTSNKILKVWDEITGREVRALQGHRDQVTDVALSADGQLAVSASKDKTLKVWDVATGRELHTLQGHSREVNGVALSADGRLAVSTSFDDETLKVWDVVAGKGLRTVVGHRGNEKGVALSADGRLAILAEDETLKLLDVATGRELHTLQGHNNWVVSVAISADGQLAISASRATSSSDPPPTLKVWDVVTGRELCTLAGHSDRVNGVALSADGRIAVSASEDETLKVWNLSELLTGLTKSVKQAGVIGRKFSDHRELGAANLDNATSRKLRTLQRHSDVVYDGALSADGRLAVSASVDKTLKVWDVATGRELHTLQRHSDVVCDVALSADGRLVVSASKDKTLKVWDVATGRELRTLLGHSLKVSSVALSADGRHAVSASGDGTLKVWDVATGRELRTLTCSDKVTDVALSADGQLAVTISATADNFGWVSRLEVWDVETGREPRTLTDSNFVCSVALSVDGRLAIASKDETLKVWDVATGRELHALQGHTGGVTDVALSADGQLAVSASKDKTLKAWDVATGQVLSTVSTGVHSTCCAITPDGKTIVAGDSTGGVHFLEWVGGGLKSQRQLKQKLRRVHRGSRAG